MSDRIELTGWPQIIADANAGDWEKVFAQYRATAHPAGEEIALWRGLGRELSARGAPAAGIVCLERAQRLDPQNADILTDYGAALSGLGRIAEALSAFEAAHSIAPDRVSILSALGSLSMRVGRPGDAKKWFQDARLLAPGDPTVLSNLGAALSACGAWTDAVAVLEEAVVAKSDFGEAYLNLGVALQKLEDYPKAIDAYNKAAAHGSPPAIVTFNVATLHEARGDIARSIRHLDRAIEIDPSYADARRNRGLLHFLSGRWQDGWSDYEWRWQCADMAPQRRPFPQARWDGQNAKNALLIWGEQGVGDEIFYGGQIRRVVAGGLPVTLEADRRLVGLLSRGMPAVRVIARSSPPNPTLLSDRFDAQAPAGSVPGIMRTNAAEVMERWSPHLKADRRLIGRFIDRFRATSRKPTICLAWRSFNPQFGSNKSIQPAEIAEVVGGVDAQWIDVQYGDVVVDRAVLARDVGPVIRTVPDVDVLNDLDSLAAMLAAADLVVTASNVVAHLAGAMGLQCWVLVPASTAKLWYWSSEGESCPWYPSVRLFRQNTPGSWREPLESLTRDLRHFVSIYGMNFGTLAAPDSQST